jgi:hypothetical protein
MSSTLFKTVFAGAVSAAALLMPVSAAQAADKCLPCGGAGFGGGFDGGFFPDRVGFRNDGLWDDGFDAWDDGFGFPAPHRRHHDITKVHNTTTVIVVTAPQKQKHHHHKPGNTGNAAGAGYHMPTGHGNSAGSGDGYHK